jgi:hypothetical protein
MLPHPIDGDKPLVGVNLTGGLGNQMFQYAAGLALAEQLGAQLLCDCYFYTKPAVVQRQGLSEFGIQVVECRDPRPWGALRAIGRTFGADKHNPLRRAVRFTEDISCFNSEVLQLTAPCYLVGHFQSWRYFAGHEASVRRSFDWTRIGNDQTKAVEAQIRAATNPVAVHVRRGDYTKPDNVEFFGLLGADYYRRAREAIEASVVSPTYFLFSDDPAAAQAELKDWPDMVPVGGFSAHEDLKLMALCNHFIIANSTFSWWAAWLGQSPEKRVVAPVNWFAPAHAGRTSLADRYPANWLRE